MPIYLFLWQKQASLELRLEPDSAAAYPGRPSELIKSRVNSIATLWYLPPSSLTITLGDLPPHGLRIRSEGVNWAVEGGSWRHFLPPGRLPIDELAVAGVQELFAEVMWFSVSMVSLKHGPILNFFRQITHRAPLPYPNPFPAMGRLMSGY